MIIIVIIFFLFSRKKTDFFIDIRCWQISMYKENMTIDEFLFFSSTISIDYCFNGIFTLLIYFFPIIQVWLTTIIDIDHYRTQQTFQYMCVICKAFKSEMKKKQSKIQWRYHRNKKMIRIKSKCLFFIQKN